MERVMPRLLKKFNLSFQICAAINVLYLHRSLSIIASSSVLVASGKSAQASSGFLPITKFGLAGCEPTALIFLLYAADETVEVISQSFKARPALEQ